MGVDEDDFVARVKGWIKVHDVHNVGNWDNFMGSVITLSNMIFKPLPDTLENKEHVLSEMNTTWRWLIDSQYLVHKVEELTKEETIMFYTMCIYHERSKLMEQLVYADGGGYYQYRCFLEALARPSDLDNFWIGKCVLVGYLGMQTPCIFSFIKCFMMYCKKDNMQILLKYPILYLEGNEKGRFIEPLIKCVRNVCLENAEDWPTDWLKTNHGREATRLPPLENLSVLCLRQIHFSVAGPQISIIYRLKIYCAFGLDPLSAWRACDLIQSELRKYEISVGDFTQELPSLSEIHNLFSEWKKQDTMALNEAISRSLLYNSDMQKAIGFKQYKKLDALYSLSMIE